MIWSLLEKLPDSAGFRVGRRDWESFLRPPSFYRVRGPMEFYRLVQFQQKLPTGETLARSRSDGLYWFERDVLEKVRSQAREELKHIRAESPAHMAGLRAIHARFRLRDQMAISKNWNRFDAYVRLWLGDGDKIVALVGKTKGQQYYDASHPDYERIKNVPDIMLPGQGLQVLINFSFGENKKLRHQIHGPVRLEAW